jgi:hypothetical protein
MRRPTLEMLSQLAQFHEVQLAEVLRGWVN